MARTIAAIRVTRPCSLLRCSLVVYLSRWYTRMLLYPLSTLQGSSENQPSVSFNTWTCRGAGPFFKIELDKGPVQRIALTLWHILRL